MINLLIATAFCLGGLAILMKSADMLIDGGLVIAHKLNLSKMLIGMTLLAFGTSAPEMVVNFFAAYKGQGNIVAGNIIGSNLVNLVIGIGGAALIMPLNFTNKNCRLDYPLGIIGLLFFFVIADMINLNRFITGGAMLTVFAIYLWHALKSDNNNNNNNPEEQQQEQQQNQQQEQQNMLLTKAILFTIIGLIGLFIGGKFTVDGAVNVARILEIRETVIALTVIAIGTSAPEVITCIQAARKGHGDIAIGNIAGSQIFNGLWVLGGSTIIAQINYSKIIYQDLTILTILTLIVIAAPKLFTQKTHKITAATMIAIYTLYIIYIVAREIT